MDGETQARGWRADRAVPAEPLIPVIVDGEHLLLPAGQSLAVSLALVDRLTLRHSPTAGTPRGMFCLMGSCQECLVHVDGVATLSCLEPVRAGMSVELDRLRAAKEQSRDQAP